MEELKKKSGYTLKWVVEYKNNSNANSFPSVRGEYLIALRGVALRGLQKNKIDLVNVCLSPGITSFTYLSNKMPIPSIKSFFVRTINCVEDFSDKLEYFYLDLNKKEDINVNIVGADGEKIEDVKGCLIFDVVEVQ